MADSSLRLEDLVPEIKEALITDTKVQEHWPNKGQFEHQNKYGQKVSI